LIVLNFSPAYEALFQRNAELFELILITFAMWAFLRDKQSLAGVLIALAAGIKFLPGVIIIYFLISKQKRAAKSAMLVLALIVITTQISLGWQHNATLTYLVTGNDPYFENIYHTIPTNQSVTGLVIRTMVDIGIDSGHILVSRVTIVSLGILLALWIWRQRDTNNWMLHWSVLLVGVVFLLPHNQPYYLSLLIPAYIIALRELSLGSPAWHWMIFWCSYLAVGWPIPLSLIQRFWFQDIWLIQSLYRWSVPVYGAIGLVVVLILSSKRNNDNIVKAS
jgi:hypothetical protein